MVERALPCRTRSLGPPRCARKLPKQRCARAQAVPFYGGTSTGRENEKQYRQQSASDEAFGHLKLPPSSSVIVAITVDAIGATYAIPPVVAQVGGAANSTSSSSNPRDPLDAEIAVIVN